MTKQVILLSHTTYGQTIPLDIDEIIRDKLTETRAEGRIESTLVHVESLQLLVSALVQILADKEILDIHDLNKLVTPISYSRILKVVEKEEE